MDLFVYKGEWNLPTMDLDCLRTLVFIKITKAPVKVHTGTSTFWSPNGLLPYLVGEDGRKHAGFKEITTYLVSLGYSIQRVNNEDDFDDSYIAVLRQNLYPYFLYNQWHPQNVDHSRTLYATRIPFPFNFISPKQYFKRAERTVSNLYGFSIEAAIEKHNFTEMALKAKQVLNELEQKLSSLEWAAGKDPGILDVHIYPFAALIYHNQLPNNALQAHIQQCPSLVKYVERVTKKFFRNEGFSSQQKAEKQQNGGKEKKFYTGQEDEEDPRERRKRYFLSGLVATLSMVSYAVFKGILHLPYDGHDGQGYIDYTLDDEDDGGDQDE